MPTCKLCLQDKELIKKSHIIPDFMFRHSEMYNEKHQIHTFSLQDLIEGKKPHMVSTGEYEGNILCADCDNGILGSYESYARLVIFGDKTEKEVVECEMYINDEGEKFSICQNVKYTPYKLFMLSILWRMSISSRPMFQGIKLNAHEERLREMLFNKDAKEFYVYPVLSSSFLKDPKISKDIIVQPLQYNHGGFTKVDLILPGMFHVFILSTDANAFTLEELKRTVINENNELFVYELEDGKTMDYIKRVSGII